MSNKDVLSKSKELIIKKQYKEAKDLLEEVYNSPYSDDDIAVEYAKVLLKFNDCKDEGEKILLELLNNNKKVVYVLKELGKFKERENLYSEAREYYNKLLKCSNYGKITGLSLLGKLEKRLGNYELALQHCNNLLNFLVEDKNRLETKLNNLDINNTERKNINKKLNINSYNLMDTYILLGDINFDLANYLMAYKYYSAVIENNGKDKSYAKFKMGKIEIKRKRYNIAREIFVSLLEEEGKFKQYSLLELAKLEVKHKNIDEARNYLTMLMELYPSDRLFAMQELGELESSISNFDEALKYYNIVLNEGKEKDKLYSMLAISKLEFKRDRIDEAKNYLNYMIGYCSYAFVDEKNKKLLFESKNRAMLELGKIEMILGNYNVAREIFNDLYSNGMSSDKSLALNNLIYLDIHEGKYNEAYVKLNELIEANVRLDKNEIMQISLFLKNKLRLLSRDDYARLSYFDKQLLFYRPCACKNHIRNYIDSNQGDGYYFLREDIDIDNLFSYIEGKIYDNMATDVAFMDKYIVDVGYVAGSLNGNDISAFEVVTLPNTKNIISIHPVINNSKKVKKKIY